MTYGVTLALLAAAHAYASPHYRSGSVAQPDGARIAYYIREGRGPTLVLVPGSWGDFRVFDRLVEHLTPSMRVVVVELRGHGGSQPAARQPTMTGLAKDVLSVVDALGIQRFYVGGHSIGGMLAIEIAGQRPALVAGAIAMEGWTHHLVSSEAFGGDTRATLTAEQERVNNVNRQRVLSRLSREEAQAFASVWKRWDGLPILEKSPVAILEIWGDRGRPRPSRERLRIPDRPNIELVWMDGASHSLLVQCPERVADAINGFVRRVEAGGAATR